MNTRKLSDDHFSGEFPRGIGRPANAALVDNGFTTLEQVAAMSEAELLAIHGVGPRAVAVLKSELERQGRNLTT